jgi:dihydropyrimidinase
MQAVLQEDISILSTDHCPYSIKYKMGYDNENLPCGVDGVQTRMNYLFSEAVNKRGLSMEAFARLTSTNAAKFYGLYPKKGTIAVGSDADLAIIDPNRRWVYTMDAVAGATDYSIFDNFPLTGKCVCTIKNGEVVMNEGDFFVSKGSGRFLPVTYKTEGK